MIVRESKDTFYILGNGCSIFAFSLDSDRPDYDILSLEEGKFENGCWIPDRRLNGDEALSISFDQYRLLKMRVFCY